MWIKLKHTVHMFCIFMYRQIQNENVMSIQYCLTYIKYILLLLVAVATLIHSIRSWVWCAEKSRKGKKRITPNDEYIANNSRNKVNTEYSLIYTLLILLRLLIASSHFTYDYEYVHIIIFFSFITNSFSNFVIKGQRGWKKFIFI